ncbi:MAG TPA: YdeI/OmpD-associated family protein [Terriglobia bacterium]|nr:YdeI/OmpD-associated family protein [Terriglobia bacterium]
MGTQKKFRGVLQPDNTPLKWVIVKVPFDPVKAWPTRNRLHVKGTINGFPFRTSLFGSAKDGHVLLVNKQMQRGGKVFVGGQAEVVLEPDLEERVASIPLELGTLLKQDRALKKWYEQLSYSARKDIENTVSEGRSSEVRQRRAEQMAERMLLAMEGEHEPPPILQVAFRRQPRAQAGWQAMTPVQRRGHLLGIFYYQSPEARQKRAEKAIAEALKIADRTNHST